MQDYLYSVIGLIAIVIQLIINYKFMFGHEINYNQKAVQQYRFLLFSFLVYYITDALWGILGGLNWIPALFFDTTIYNIAMAAAVLCVYRYIIKYLEMKGWLAKFFNYFGIGFFIFQIVFQIVNIFYPCFFWFDANDAYVAGPIRNFALIVQIVMFAFSSLITGIETFRNKGTNRKRYLAVFFFSFIMFVAIIFQSLFPLLPLYAVGCLLGSCILHIYVVGDEIEEYQEKLINEKEKLGNSYDQLSNYKQAVLSDALISLEVNLSKDQLYYGIWKNDNNEEVSLQDILGLTVPCSYDLYIKLWNAKFVNPQNTTSFFEKTNREYILNAFNSGISEITFDYEAKTISGKNTWLRRSICMTKNQSNDIVAYTSVKDISSLISQSKREDAYVRALSTDYDSIVVVDFDANKYDDKVVIKNRLSNDFIALIDEETIKEVNYFKKMQLLSRFIHKEDCELFKTNVDRDVILETFKKDKTHVVDFRLMRENGDYYYYQIRFISLKNDDEFGGMIVCLRNIDVEIRKELAIRKELEDAKIAADSANQAKSKFLFNMSHDIRTPMNAILGYTDLAINHANEIDKVNDCLKKIKFSGTHLLRLINDILEMSRIEADRLELVNVPLNINKAVSGVEYMSRSLAISKNIDFIVSVSEIKNPYIYADELHINEVLINLISNAIKYTNSGGTVEYIVSQIGVPENGIARFRFIIKDNGIGMSEEFQKHLFESFSRENSSTVSKQEGTGLGLSIVKKIVDLSNGTISVESKKDFGSTFTVELPFRVMDDAEIDSFILEENEASKKRDSDALEGKRVLLVEDNEFNREIATEILVEAGLIVDVAEDGQIAVNTIAEKGVSYYDFVLTDIQMPVMNGYEETRVIRSMPGGDKMIIIALSANAFEEDKQESLANGMNGHIAKPIDVNELFNTLKQFMKN